MTRRFADLAFTPAVQALQRRHGSRAAYARMTVSAGGAPDRLGDDERAFLDGADGLFVATVGETGWPYVQHRGGPRGFLRVVAAGRIAFADFRGNRQYLSAGNVAKDDRAAMIVMDWAHRRRLKLLGRLRFEPVEEADPALVRAVDLSGYDARVERVAIFDVEAFDWNCPQHIVPRWSEDEIAAGVAPLHARIAELEARLAAATR